MHLWLYPIKLLLVFVFLFGIPGLLLANGILRIGFYRFPTIVAGAILGIAIVTQFTDLLSLLIGFGEGAILLGWLFACALGLAQQWRNNTVDSGVTSSLAGLSRPSWTFWVISACVAVLALAANLTIATKDSAFFPYFFRDASARITFIDAILRTGILPLNIFTNVGIQPVLAYPHFFFESCAMIVTLAGVPTIVAYPFMVGISTFAFLSVNYLFASYYFGSRHAVRLYLVLLFCGGLDLLMTGAQEVGDWISKKHIRFENIDFWAHTPQISLLTEFMVRAPHHIFSGSLALILILAVTDVRNLKTSTLSLLSVSIALASVTGFDLLLLLSLAPCLAAVGIWHLYKKEYEPFITIAVVSIVSIIIALPFLYQLFAHSGQTATVELGLMAPHKKPFTALFGSSLLAKLSDLSLYLFLEFGVLLVLAVPGAKLIFKQRINTRVSIGLLIFTLTTFAEILFLRGPGENFPASMTIPINIGLACFTAAWVMYIFEQRQLSKSIRRAIVAALFIQLLASCYSLLGDTGIRFFPKAKLEAKRHRVAMDALTQLDAQTAKPSYRVQILPPEIALDNDTIPTFMAVYFPRSRPLFDGGGALSGGYDKKEMEGYLTDLCKLYQGDDGLLARELTRFDFAAAVHARTADPWHPVVRYTLSCISKGKAFDPRFFVGFVRQYALNFVLIAPSDKRFLKALPAIQAMAVADIIELKGGFLLLKFSQ